MNKSNCNNYMKYIINLFGKKYSEKNNRIGNYSINNICGTGSNGIVFNVTSLRDNKQYALKILNVSYYIIENFNLSKKMYMEEISNNLDSIVKTIDNEEYNSTDFNSNIFDSFNSKEELNSFLREYNSLKALKSNNYCINLVDYGFFKMDSSCEKNYVFPYIVMPYFYGIKLTEYIENSQNFTTNFKEIFGLVEKITKIIKYIHSNRIIHRDLHLENFLYNEKNGQLILLDFGSAIYNNDFSLDILGERRGPRRLMSPEQFKNPSDIKYFSDYYFLGGILFYMLTKKYPFSVDRTINTFPTDLRKVLDYKAFNEKSIYNKIVNFVNNLLIYDSSKRITDINEIEERIFEIKKVLINEKYNR